MAIDLSEEVVTAKTVYVGDDTFELVAEKTLKIESSPSGDTFYDDTVPEGKVWAVTVFLRIVETDA